MRKVIFSLLAFTCLLCVLSCSNGPDYTCKELFGKETLSKRSHWLNRVMTIYETEKGLCLNGPSGPVVGDKVYVNAPERTPQVGDKVIIFGNAPAELTQLARMADTIEYEALCLVTSRVPRIEIDS